MIYTRPAEGGTDIRCVRHLFSLNKWQYHDKYIIVIVVLREKFKKKITIKKLQKKWHKWYSNPGSPPIMVGTLTTEPQGDLVTASDQAYW